MRHSSGNSNQLSTSGSSLLQEHRRGLRDDLPTMPSCAFRKACRIGVVAWREILSQAHIFHSKSHVGILLATIIFAIDYSLERLVRALKHSRQLCGCIRENFDGYGFDRKDVVSDSLFGLGFCCRCLQTAWSNSEVD
jgi:hypothetical protein